MDILIYLKNIVKLKGPNSISSFKDDIEYNNIKKLGVQNIYSKKIVIICLVYFTVKEILNVQRLNKNR